MELNNHLQSEPYPYPPEDINLECSQELMIQFMDALQRHFKKDTSYNRPLFSPQMNTVFALDREVARNMALYIKSKLTESCGFHEDEFRITHRYSAEGQGLQRLRLHFCEGVTFEIIRKISAALIKLETEY